MLLDVWSFCENLLETSLWLSKKMSYRTWTPHPLSRLESQWLIQTFESIIRKRRCALSQFAVHDAETAVLGGQYRSVRCRPVYVHHLHHVFGALQLGQALILHLQSQRCIMSSSPLDTKQLRMWFTAEQFNIIVIRHLRSAVRSLTPITTDVDTIHVVWISLDLAK